MPQKTYDYIPTQLELDLFIKDKNGHTTNPVKIKKSEVTYCLIQGNVNMDAYFTIVEHSKPYPLLQTLKKQRIFNGIQQKHLSIVPLGLAMEKLKQLKK